MFRRPGRGRLLLLVFLAFSVVLITLDFRQGEGGPLETARDVAASVVAPIQRGFTTVFRPVGDFFSSLGDLGELRKDNAEMEAQIEELTQEAAQADELISENVQLRQELDLDEHWSTMDTLHAVITSRVPDNYKWAVTIDKGSDDGIRKDMAVINKDGLVGRVVEVDPNEATILLLIDPEAAAAARIKVSRDTGTVQGHGPNQDLSMDFVPGEARVDVNDLVITSGFDDGIFPPGIPIGNVTEVSGESSDLQQDIKVEPKVDFNALEFVTILLESGPNLDDPDEKGKKDRPRNVDEAETAQGDPD
jgi:rod shape-determining protein MreC